MKSETPTVVCKPRDFLVDPEAVYSGEQVIKILETANAERWLLTPTRFYASRIMAGVEIRSAA